MTTTEPIGLFVVRSAKALSRSFDATLAGSGGSLAAWLVLASLAGGLRSSQRTIARDLGIEGATLTHHLHRMEAAGLVSRERGADDRRTQTVELTGAGREQFAALLLSVQAFDERLHAGFTEAELEILRELLQRLADNAAADRTPGRP